MMRWLKRGILRVVNSLVSVVIPPLMRWLADGSKEFDPPGPLAPDVRLKAGVPKSHAEPGPENSGLSPVEKAPEIGPSE